MLDKRGSLSGKNVCLESYRTESSNEAGEVTYWSIWVVFGYYFWAQKYDFLKSNADSERKLIPEHQQNSRPFNTNEIEKLVILDCILIVRSNSSRG